MTVIPASRLSRADLYRLGNNMPYTVRRDRSELSAINRSLAIHKESVNEVAVLVHHEQDSLTRRS